MLVLTVGITLWPVVLGLIIGGIVAAPFGALATRYLPERVLLFIVGAVVVALSLRTILRYVTA